MNTWPKSCRRGSLGRTKMTPHVDSTPIWRISRDFISLLITFSKDVWKGTPQPIFILHYITWPRPSNSGDHDYHSISMFHVLSSAKCWSGLTTRVEFGSGFETVKGGFLHLNVNANDVRWDFLASGKKLFAGRLYGMKCRESKVIQFSARRRMNRNLYHVMLD